jgi:processive 1,2-diacylglycerol beta-glucosyltransferase
MRNRLLFFYSFQFSGHHRAALALQSAFKAEYPDIQTLALEFFQSAYPRIGRALTNWYPKMMKEIPNLWRAFYSYLYCNQDFADATRDIRKFFNWLYFAKLERTLKEYKPDAIICTQAAPCHVVSAYKREKGNGLPLVAVITDYLVHPYWLDDKVDLYIVPTEETRGNLIDRGIPEGKIKEIGIPIDPKFTISCDKQKRRKEIGLAGEVVTLLITGGSRGMVPVEKILRLLCQVNVRFQAIVVTGKNKKLWWRIKKMERGLSFTTKVLSYTDKMDSLMDASDLIITKPGGLTSAEALAKGLPLIIVKPLPGQEERNGRYLIDQGAGLWIDHLKDLPEVIEELVISPSKKEAMSRKAQLLARPRAGWETAKAIMELLG